MLSWELKTLNKCVLHVLYFCWDKTLRQLLGKMMINKYLLCDDDAVTTRKLTNIQEKKSCHNSTEYLRLHFKQSKHHLTHLDLDHPSCAWKATFGCIRITGCRIHPTVWHLGIQSALCSPGWFLDHTPRGNNSEQNIQFAFYWSLWPGEKWHGLSPSCNDFDS